MYLPQPNSTLAFNDKKNKDNGSDIDNTNTQVNIISNNALLANINSPKLKEVSTEDYSSLDQTSVYTIRSGDTWSWIAENAGVNPVSVNTVLWANDLKKGDPIKTGEELVIPPVSGLEYKVKNGETCQSIAKASGVDMIDIVNYNNLDTNCKISVGDKLFIPGANTSPESDTPIKNLKASMAKDNKYYEIHPTKNLSGYYIDPVPGYRLSQGVHDNNAVDLAISYGTPIHAAAAGTVLVAKTGCVPGVSSCGGGFGNYIVINHSNGTQTLYAHQLKLSVTTGSNVSQGQIIGYVGMTGSTTGPHLHFEVHGARNPGANHSWAH